MKKEKTTKREKTTKKSNIGKIKSVITHEYPEIKVNDFDLKEYSDLLKLFGGITHEDKNFLANSYCGVRKELLGKLDIKDLKKESNLILKMMSQKDFENFKTVKGVRYKFENKIKVKDTMIKVHSILKLSKFIAIDARITSIFKNHKFSYVNDITKPVLIINNDTHSVDGWIVANQNYWNNSMKGNK